ncbi:MAG: GNAT family N-acetyltransferase [Saccharofermentans sp.]|nr:GNAT family N-acetyltransferase [Saccharofermentans sp.]
METVFESERILFVKPNMELIPEYLVMINDIEHVARFISDRREPYTLEEEQEYMRGKIEGGAAMYSMIEKSTGKFIGNTEFFDRREDDAEWGIVITYSMQDKGFGKEALKRMISYGFGELGLERIRLGVYIYNPRAVHVYESCGFKEYHRNKVDIFMDIRKEGSNT